MTSVTASRKPLTLADLRTLVYVEAARMERCADPIGPGDEVIVRAPLPLPHGYGDCSVPWANGLTLVYVTGGSVSETEADLTFTAGWREEIPGG